jgi:cytochrome c556
MAGTGARYFFLFLVGLVIGAVASVMGMRALQARQDPFPKALMHVQQYHLAQLKGDLDANRCNATDTLPHFAALRMTADDVEAAFPDNRDDARFTKAAGQLRAALDEARASPPLSCPALGKTLESIGGACKACHQDFRG